MPNSIPARFQVSTQAPRPFGFTQDSFAIGVPLSTALYITASPFCSFLKCSFSERALIKAPFAAILPDKTARMRHISLGLLMLF